MEDAGACLGDGENEGEPWLCSCLTGPGAWSICVTLSLSFLLVPNGDKSYLPGPLRVFSELQVPGTNEGLKKGKGFLLSPSTEESHSQHLLRRHLKRQNERKQALIQWANVTSPPPRRLPFPPPRSTDSILASSTWEQTPLAFSAVSSKTLSGPQLRHNAFLLRL